MKIAALVAALAVKASAQESCGAPGAGMMCPGNKFCNMDDGDTGFCETCPDNEGECFGSGLPGAGVQDCVNLCTGCPMIYKFDYCKVEECASADATTEFREQCVDIFSQTLLGGWVPCLATAYGVTSEMVVDLSNENIELCGGTAVDAADINYDDNFIEGGSGGGGGDGEGSGGDDYCAPGCPQNWQGDNWCDAECDVEECGFDNGDCATDGEGDGDGDGDGDGGYDCQTCGDFYPTNCDELYDSTHMGGTMPYSGCAANCPVNYLMPLLDELVDFQYLEEDCVADWRGSKCSMYKQVKCRANAGHCQWSADDQTCHDNVEDCSQKGFKQCRTSLRTDGMCFWHDGKCHSVEEAIAHPCIEHEQRGGCLRSGCDWKPKLKACVEAAV